MHLRVLQDSLQQRETFHKRKRSDYRESDTCVACKVEGVKLKEKL